MMSIKDSMNSEIKSSGKINRRQSSRILTNPELGLELLTSIVSNKNTLQKVDTLLHEIHEMIHVEFMELSNNENSIQSAQAYKGLIDAYKDLTEICYFPSFENKNIIAVGGHFSAGKSKFLNAITKNESLLPVGLTSTTAIPTYILSGEKDVIHILNSFQNKLEISRDALKVIAHDFNRKYKLSFSHLLKLITIESKTFQYDNIMFIDTPGYSKDDGLDNMYSNTDQKIAREHLRVADRLIWLTNITNGTITNPDIQFIKSLSHKSPILFVLNKADMVSEMEREMVVKAAKEALSDANIPYAAIIPYSSSECQEYTEQHNEIETFIRSVNTTKAGTDILYKFSETISSYLAHHESQKIWEESNNSLLKAMQFDGSLQTQLLDDSRISLNSMSNRVRKNRDNLVKIKNVITQYQNRLEDKIRELLTVQGITIIENAFVVKKAKKKPKSNTEYPEFFASIDSRIQSIKASIEDPRNIHGKVTKVGSNGVSIRVADEISAFISIMEINRRGWKDCSQVFKENMPVSVRLTGINKGFIKPLISQE